MKFLQSLFSASSFTLLCCIAFASFSHAGPRRGPRADMCPVELMSSAPSCGDASCNGAETCATCAGDCGACVCGAGGCTAGAPDGEVCDTCIADCGVCSLSNTYSFQPDWGNERFSCGDVHSGNYTALTVSAWVRFGTLVASRVWISKGAAREFLLQEGTTKEKIRFVTGSSSSNHCETGSVLAVNTWYHVVAVFDGGGAGNSTRCYIYVDGADATAAYTGTIPASITDSTGELQINDYASGNIGVDGVSYYDEVAIWYSNEAANVSLIYNGGTPGSLTGLGPDVWYRMGDDAADDFTAATGTLRDQIGANHCTPANTAAADKQATVP